MSVFNALLLVVVTILDDYCEAHPSNGGPDVNASPSPCSLNKMARVDYLRGLITIECMGVAALWGNYIRMVREFNRCKSDPDAFEADTLARLQEELGVNREDLDTYGHAGSVPHKALRDKVLELQAEKIRYKDRQVQDLNRLVQELEERCQRAEGAVA